MYCNIYVPYLYVTFFIKSKTVNQLKIHLVYLLTDENEYVDDSFVVVLSRTYVALRLCFKLRSFLH